MAAHKFHRKDTNDSETSDTSIMTDTPEDKVKPRRMMCELGEREEEAMRKKNLPVPKRILKVTKEQYDRAVAFLESPNPPYDGHFPSCTDGTFGQLLHTGYDDFEQLMSDNYLFQEMSVCLEKGDIDGFLGVAVGGFSTRNSKRILYSATDLVLAACFALFYHPASKDEEVFQRCMEGLFNRSRIKLGSTDQILRTIMSAFEFEEQS